jgi:hypothetical protein
MKPPKVILYVVKSTQATAPVGSMMLEPSRMRPCSWVCRPHFIFVAILSILIKVSTSSLLPVAIPHIKAFSMRIQRTTLIGASVSSLLT